MRVPTAKPLLARTHPDRFIGREAELERLYLRAVGSSGRPAVHVSAPSGAGVSELLRQLYDRLFTEQRFVVPFYFSLRVEDGSAHASAARYMYEFLLQAVAFRRQEASLLAAKPDICELGKLAPIQDADWVSQMCEACRNDGPLNDERAFIRTALNAPFRASASAPRFQPVVIVDDIHEAALLRNGDVFCAELLSIAERPNVPVIVGSRKRAALHFRASQHVEIEALGRKALEELAVMLALDADVKASPEAINLIAVQMAGKPALIAMLVQAARSNRKPLASFRDVEQLYSEELLRGRLGAFYDEIFARAAPDPALRQKLYDELYLTIGEVNESFPVENLKERLAVEKKEFAAIVAALTVDDILIVDRASACISNDEVLRAFLAARHRPAAGHRSPAAVAAFTVTSALKRAPKIMSGTYRREAAFGITDALLAFDLQDVPRALIDFRIFRDELKGLSAAEMRAKLAAGGETFALPQIAHADTLDAYLPELAGRAELERAVIGVGFAERGYLDEVEVAWFAAEIDSKLEADAALTSEWCERFAAAAAELGYSSYRVWLIAPEGFTDAALEILEEVNGYGTSRGQAELLIEMLSGSIPEKELTAETYEMVIPVGEDTELVAAYALEEIVRKYKFPVKTVNQVKTALVEACINAAEHGLSPDQKIHQKFEISDEMIKVTVSNRGMRMTEKADAKTAVPASEGRRGWGLGIIRSLMDDVRIESLDDGTRIVMTKFVKAGR